MPPPETVSDQDLLKKIATVPAKAGCLVIQTAVTLYILLTDTAVPMWAKISIVAALGYFISPIDALPDFLPGGYVDDLGVMTLLLGQLDVFVDAEGSILCCVSEAEYEKAKKAFETLNRNWGTNSEIKATLAFLESTTLFDSLADDEKRNAAFKRDIVGDYSTFLPDLDKVRDTLDRLFVDTYDWRDNPKVKGKVKQLAEAEYNAGGSDKVLLKIDEMDDAQLKQYLKRLVKDSITVGIEILANGAGK